MATPSEHAEAANRTQPAPAVDHSDGHTPLSGSGTQESSRAISPHAATPTANQSIAASRNKTGRRIIILLLVVVALGAAAYFGYPTLERMLNTVSTDDAYVNGHVTFVAARVPGQVMKVLVDDNNHVRKGDILIELDKTPYIIDVNIKKAAVDTANANVLVAEDEVRGLVAKARANRYKLQHAVEDVNNQIAVLRANVASLQTSKARLGRAKSDYDRALAVQKTPGAISDQDVDFRKEAYLVAEAQVKQALEQVYQVRVSLGLKAQPETGELSDVPTDLDQNFSTVREALADLLQSAAPLGIVPPSYVATPKEVIEAFYKRDPSGNLDKIYAKLIEEAPDIQLAKAKLLEAESDLHQSELNLSYCDVVSEIDGVVTRRNVNPGNNVQAGQSLMAVRSLREIWIDANFKETQLGELRIGQRVVMRVDMYGRRHEFEGRITGFTMGTGSTLAILPAENATGNFIKVVQRLPVRIEPTNYDPEHDPLFIGLSVVPYVYIKEPPTGPNAGEFLQPFLKLPTASLDEFGNVKPVDLEAKPNTDLKADPTSNGDDAKTNGDKPKAGPDNSKHENDGTSTIDNAKKNSADAKRSNFTLPIQPPNSTPSAPSGDANLKPVETQKGKSP